MWYIYILKCNDDSLYTGITTDLERRVKEHNCSLLGAKYTRARRPVELVYSEEHNSRSEASRREHEIKKMKTKQKQLLVNE